MTQNAQVIALLQDGSACVRIERMSACGHDCSTCEGCGMMAAPIEVIAQNPISAAVGDMVTIESGSKRVIGLAFGTYLLPVILFFAAFALARMFFASEALCGVIGVLGFVVGLLGAVYCNRLGQIPTVITAITDRSDFECSDM